MAGAIQCIVLRLATKEKKEIIINRLKSNDMSRFCLADGKCSLGGCIFEINTETGKTVNIERVLITEK